MESELDAGSFFLPSLQEYSAADAGGGDDGGVDGAVYPVTPCILLDEQHFSPTETVSIVIRVRKSIGPNGVTCLTWQ